MDKVSKLCLSCFRAMLKHDDNNICLFCRAKRSRAKKDQQEKDEDYRLQLLKHKLK